MLPWHPSSLPSEALAKEGNFGLSDALCFLHRCLVTAADSRYGLKNSELYGILLSSEDLQKMHLPRNYMGACHVHVN